ncbi:uncharacterized protein EV420DRAFT_1506584 [Desarmillaria tabescens]|uniref:J domain-containing protein n=1 Tax=Armillaria tabescens TaxID=1929756 RepID=A0AA39TQI3_ARMTA|nr:uncharacterized protein EV420DRAFT_1506584 [Desarmillaria tabescens]KAK0466992.1 hypothetical protein EV420DRAFT_1506584 [Desarmillaria tabescens]
MESNKDEAIRCLAIAQKHRDAGNYPSARKFCQKSLALFETPEALKLLASLNVAENGSDSTPSSSSSSTEAHPSSSGTRHRHTNNASSPSSSMGNGTAGGIGGEKREYTAEQISVVKRVRACKVTEYYEILSVRKTCEEADVKKAYRKLALALHPDKNGAPGADEAFKMVSKAFQVLSDAQKRAIYDQSGADPEDRSGGMSSRPSGFSSRPFASPGQGFDGELSPEDLFNMFFGGGSGFGNGFGGGPVFTASFGPGGFRTTRAGGPTLRRQQQEAAEPRSLLVQLLPLFILFGFSILSALPNLFSSPPIPDPRYSFVGGSRYSVERETADLGVKYYVNPGEWTSHPVVGPEVARQKSSASSSNAERGPAVAKFERSVDTAYTERVYSECRRGLDQKDRAKEAEIGLFGFGTDWEKVKKIESEVIESCVEFERLNARRRR